MPEVGRIEHKEVPEAHLQFETLLADISARFLGISPHDVDAGIDKALETIRDFFGFEHVRFFPGRSASRRGVPDSCRGHQRHPGDPGKDQLCSPESVEVPQAGTRGNTSGEYPGRSAAGSGDRSSVERGSWYPGIPDHPRAVRRNDAVSPPGGIHAGGSALAISVCLQIAGFCGSSGYDN